MAPRRKIVILDPLPDTRNKILLPLKGVGEYELYSSFPKTVKETIERVQNADAIIVTWVRISKDILEKAPRLKLISACATGVDFIDVHAATGRGITVTNVRGYATEAVAEHVYAMLLALTRRIIEANQYTKKGKWSSHDLRHFNYLKGIELKGRTLGIIGLGKIGARVAEVAKCFRMKILVHDPYVTQERVKEVGVNLVDLKTLLVNSDVITVHVPLTSETRGMIGEEEFNQMKRGAIFINAARGAVVNERALYEALKEGRLTGACLDVFEEEPPSPDNPILKLGKVVVTPHIGFNTEEACKECVRIAVENVVNFFKGKPKNVVNLETLQWFVKGGEG